MEIPKSFKDLVGTKATMSGGIFGRKEIKPTEFEVIGLRWGSGIIMNMKTMEEKHPTIELLVKNDSMQRARWTRGFPVREIDLSKLEESGAGE